MAPHESPVASLNTWGQYAGDVQFILHRTGPSLMDHPPFEGSVPRGPERGLHRQSLPIMAKLRTPGDRSLLRRREPRRKSLTFTGGPRGLRDILSGGRLGDSDSKRCVLRVTNGHQGLSMSPCLSGARLEDITRLVRLQRETMATLDRRMVEYEAELQAYTDKRGANDEDSWVAVMDEVAQLEQQMRKNQVEVEEEEFWTSELQIEWESERQLEDRLQELRGRLHACEVELGQRLSCLQGVKAGLEAQRLQKEMRETQQASEGEVKARLQRVKAELKAQAQHTAQLESSCRAVERSLSQSGKRLQVGEMSENVSKFDTQITIFFLA